MTNQTVGFYLLYFYVDVVGLPLAYYQWGMVAYAVWNAVNDPLAGHLSDRTRSRWGRRIPLHPVPQTTSGPVFRPGVDPSYGGPRSLGTLGACVGNVQDFASGS